MDLFIKFLVAAIGAGTPLLFGTVGEILNEKVGHLNLGVEGMMAIGACAGFMGGYLSDNFLVALVCAFLAGLLAGLATGLFHTLCGIPAILAGILTQLALYSVNLRIMGQANRPINSIQYDVLLSSRDVRALSIQNPIFIGAIFVVVIIAVLYWFFGTELGSSLRATGANQNMARAQGINTNFTKVLGLMLSNGLVALSSALLAQYQGFADVNMGRGAIVIGLAAVIIGEVLFSRVFHNFGLKLLAVAIGAVLYYLVYQVVIWLGLNPDDMKLVTALIVAAFLAIPYWKGKYARVKVPAGGAKAEVKTGGEQDA